MSQTEVEFIRRAQAGNADAFGHLYQLHIDAITRFIRRKVGELDEVENLTQAVFMKAWQAIARYQPDKAPFRAWLYRIAGNTVIDHFRTRQDVDDIDAHQWLPDERALPEDRFLASERAEIVQRAVDSLRPNYRQVISLRFLEGYDYDEAAQTLDREVNSVRVTQFRALGALKKVLSSEPVLWLATLATALSLVLGSTVTVAADRSLPGDRLYGVKQSVENARLARTDDAGDVALYLDFADRRLDEASRLLAAGRTDDLTMAVNAYNQEVNRGLVSLTALVYSEPDSELTELTAARLATQQMRLAEIGAAGDESGRLPMQQAQIATEQVMNEIEKLRKAPPPPAEDRNSEAHDAQGRASPTRDEQSARASERPAGKKATGNADQSSGGASKNMSQPDPHRQPVAIPAPSANQGAEGYDRWASRTEAEGSSAPVNSEHNQPPSTQQARPAEPHSLMPRAPARAGNASAPSGDQSRLPRDDRSDRELDDGREVASNVAPLDNDRLPVRDAEGQNEPAQSDRQDEGEPRLEDRKARPVDDRDQARAVDDDNPAQRDDSHDNSNENQDKSPARKNGRDGGERRP